MLTFLGHLRVAVMQHCRADERVLDVSTASEVAWTSLLVMITRRMVSCSNADMLVPDLYSAVSTAGMLLDLVRVLIFYYINFLFLLKFVKY